MDTSKQPWEWEEEDLLNLIEAKIQEHVALEYKRCDALQNTDGKKTELSKDVSAFANSAGGTIVYGMIEDKHVPTGIDDGFEPDVITKEWIDQVLGSRIQRRIDGIRIKQVSLSGARTGRVAYVVYVPQSTRAPHQAHDKKFYKRFNFQSVAMEEYEIRDVSRRSESPLLSVGFWFDKGRVRSLECPMTPAGSCSNADEVILRPYVENSGAAPAKYFIARLYLDVKLAVDVWQGYGVGPVESVTVEGCTFGARCLSTGWIVPPKMPVFEGEPLPLDSVRVTLRPREGEFMLGWIIRAPRAPEQRGCAKLVSDGSSARIAEVLAQAPGGT